MSSKIDNVRSSICKKIALLAVVGVISVLCDLCCTRLQLIDLALLHSTGTTLKPTLLFVDPIVQYPLTTAVLYSAFSIGSLLSLLPRLIGCMQLLAVMIAMQGVLARCFTIETSVVPIILALSLGCMGGYVLRQARKNSQKLAQQKLELVVRQKELEEARLLIIKQDECERRMLAADLHDQVLNDLRMIRVGLRELHTRFDTKSVLFLEEQLSKSMDDVREIMENLSPSSLEHLGLLPAMEDCVRQSAGRSSLRVKIKRGVPESTRLPFSRVTESLLYRLVQETMTNIRKHAAATSVRAGFYLENSEFVVRISDDGKGLRGAGKKIESRGMRFMKLRADLIGARVSWGQGDNGIGTCVEIRMGLGVNYDNTRTCS